MFGGHRWEECSTSVYFDMLGDWMKNFDPPIPAMLQAGIHVMIYAGTEDFICNWVGNQHWVNSLPWYGKGQWAAAKEQEWTVDGESAGTVKAVGPLSFVKVDAAGHMVSVSILCTLILHAPVILFWLMLKRHNPICVTCIILVHTSIPIYFYILAFCASVSKGSAVRGMQ